YRGQRRVPIGEGTRLREDGLEHHRQRLLGEVGEGGGWSEQAQPEQRAEQIVAEIAEGLLCALELCDAEKLVRFEEFGNRILRMGRADVLRVSLAEQHVDSPVG